MLKKYSNMFALISDLAKISDESNESSSYSWQSRYHQSLKQVLKDIGVSDERSKDKVKKVESLLYTMIDTFNKYSNIRTPKEILEESVNKIYNAHQVEQRSEKWYEDMKYMLTASEFSSLFEGERTYCNLVLSKVNPEKRNSPKACPTNSLVATGWGIRFEPTVRNYLEKLWKCKIYESGRLKHTTNTNLGASPDGIITDSEDRFGRLVEIKCPYSRKIGEGIPFKYWVQMQIQMEVTNLFECEYVEVEIVSTNPKNLTVDLSNNYLEKGNIYLMEKNCEYIYLYTEEDKNKYLELEYNLMEEIPYGIKNIYNVCVKRDISWYKSTEEVQTKFWNDVKKAEEGSFAICEPRAKKQKIKECLITEET